VLIGAGIPFFGSLPGGIALEHVATSQYASGLVQSEYVVAVQQGLQTAAAGKIMSGRG